MKEKMLKLTGLNGAVYLDWREMAAIEEVESGRTIITICNSKIIVTDTIDEIFAAIDAQLEAEFETIKGIFEGEEDDM